MKFKDLLVKVSNEVTEYRRDIFNTIILGLIIGTRRKCIYHIFRTFQVLAESIGLTEKRFYMFLQSSKIPLNRMWKVIYELIGEEMLENGKIIIALDDTTYAKSGKKISGANTHYDHAAKQNCSKYVWGHCRVVIGILKSIHGRWACLPLAQSLYIPVKNAGNNFETKIDAAGRLIGNFAKMVNYDILVITDSWFGNKSLWKHLCDLPVKVHILTRLRINSVLYDFPDNSGERKGRKRKYGERLKKLPELALDMERQIGLFMIYGKIRKCNYAEFECMHKGFKMPVKIVLVYMKSRVFPILSTDTTLTAQEMIEHYSARWKIESGFKELKHEIGALDNQARKKESVENHFELCCMAVTMTWIYAMKREKAPAKRLQNLRTFTFSDIREEIRKEYTDKSINFNGVCSKTLKRAGNIILNSFFREVA
jgi:hypothetical protein